MYKTVRHVECACAVAWPISCSNRRREKTAVRSRKLGSALHAWFFLTRWLGPIINIHVSAITWFRLQQLRGLPGSLHRLVTWAQQGRGESLHCQGYREGRSRGHGPAVSFARRRLGDGLRWGLCSTGHWGHHIIITSHGEHGTHGHNGVCVREILFIIHF